MSFMQWKSEMSVGIIMLDQQHQRLIALIDRLGEEDESGDGMSYVLSELDWYVREHFRDEEEMMEAAGYANLKAHRAEHRGFEDWMRSVQAAYESGGEAKFYIADNVNAYLRDWWANHILIIDMAYKGKLR